MSKTKQNVPVFRTLYVDQHGQNYYASSLRELRKQIPGRCSKMYIDYNGKSYHVGYVIGKYWLNAFQAIVKEA